MFAAVGGLSAVTGIYTFEGNTARGQPRTMVVVLLCLAQFVVVLDATIVAIALPAIQDDLGLSTAALQWVVTAYTLAFGGTLLAAGRLADRFGRRRAFVAGLSLFALASLACGLAPSAGLLLAARAAQGLGAAVVAPAALALLTTACSNERARARALGWWTAAAAGGGASGWVLGGVLTGLLSWRWVFLINLPVCAAAVVLAPRVLPEQRERTPARADIAGAVLATAGLAALVLALTFASSRGPASPATAGALATALALLAAFARVETRAADPLLSRAVLRRARLAEPNLVAAVLTAATTPPMFLCTLYAQRVLGLDPIAAGLLFPPFNLAVIAGSLAGPRVIGALGERRAMAGGLLVIAIGAATLTAIAPGAPAPPPLFAGFVLLGAGLGVASVASTGRGTRALGEADQGLASGLLTTSAQIGTVLGLAIVVPIAAARSAALPGGPAAQVAGFELGFALSAALAMTAASTVAVRALRARRQTRSGAGEPDRAARARPRTARPRAGAARARAGAARERPRRRRSRRAARAPPAARSRRCRRRRRRGAP